MEKHILLMDFASSLNTTGVDRYLESLLYGISGFKITWLRIRTDRTIMLHQVEGNEKYTKIEIPLPENDSLILENQYWSERYFEVVMNILNRYTSLYTISIIHLHTLNLIDLAKYVKKISHCKIITHLHCIPWKNYFNTNKSRFNFLYNEYYIKNNFAKAFYQSNCNELDAYLCADKVVCLTQCAKSFVQRITGIPNQKICIIRNGIKDVLRNPIKKGSREDGIIRILFVGALSESKGIFAILDIIRRLQEIGYKIELIVAGSGTKILTDLVLLKSKGLNVKLVGRVDFDTLCYYYQYSDIGCIASLYEQSSYVAIEMAMFGLPIVTTFVDGLGEMFVDGDNAIKIDVTFHPYLGLRVNQDDMFVALCKVISNDELRAKLGAAARNSYECNFKLNIMIQMITQLYNNLI